MVLIHSFPQGGWILVFVACLWLSSETSPVARLLLAYLLLVPAYGVTVALSYLKYWLRIASLRVGLCLRLVTLYSACLLSIAWFDFSLFWQYLFDPRGYAQRIERLKRKYGINLDEEKDA